MKGLVLLVSLAGLWTLPQDKAVPPSLRQIRASVVDTAGDPVGELTPDDFILEEAGAGQPMFEFTTDIDTPTSLGILLDTSGSMRGPPNGSGMSLFAVGGQPSRVLPWRATGVVTRVFLKQMKAGDEIALMSFDPGFRVEQEFTGDPDELDRALDRLELGVYSPRPRLIEAIRNGVREMRRAAHPDRALVVVTDAINPPDAEDLGRELERSEIPVCVILVEDYPDDMGLLDYRPYVRPRERIGQDGFTQAFPANFYIERPVPRDEVLGLKDPEVFIDAVEAASGGRVLSLPNRWPDQLDALLEFIGDMNADLRGQYLITYETPDPDAALPYIRLRTTNPEYRVRILESSLVPAPEN